MSVSQKNDNMVKIDLHCSIAFPRVSPSLNFLCRLPHWATKLNSDHSHDPAKTLVRPSLVSALIHDTKLVESLLCHPFQVSCSDDADPRAFTLPRHATIRLEAAQTAQNVSTSFDTPACPL